MLAGAELRALLENPRPWMRPGFFLVIEGADGTGKDTQTKVLYDELKAAGHAATIVRDPGTTPLAETLREIVKSGPLPAEEQLLLYTAARVSLAREIEKRLAAGEIVISTRWFLSTLVYQIDCPNHTPELYGLRCSAAQREEIAVLLQKQLVGLVPDLTITLCDSGNGDTLTSRAGRQGKGDHFDLDVARNYMRDRAYRARAVAADLLDSLADAATVPITDDPAGVATRIAILLSQNPKWRYLTRPKTTQAS
jgi:dTMP kinase